MAGASTILSMGLGSCERIAARAGREAWKWTTPDTTCSSSSALKSWSFFGPQPHHQQQLHCGMHGTNSMARKQLSGGSESGPGRRGGASFLWLFTRASAREDVEYVGDGGGDLGGGSGIGRSGGDGAPGGGGGHGDGSGGNFLLAQAGAFWIWYNGALESHPLVAKSLTAGLLNAVADLVCQVFIEKVEEIDWKRLLSFVSIGIFMSGPGLHFWYGALPMIVTMPGLGGVLLRIALDQFFFTPLGMVSFFVVLCTLENRRGDIRMKLEKDWWPTVVANWKVWIPFQVVNFGFIPPQLQAGAAGLLGVIWSIFISYKGHN